MANVLIEETTMSAIGTSIRGKLGVTTTFLPEQMPAAIDSIEGGGGGGTEPVLTELGVVENGIYVPGEGIDGYNRVVVNVPAAGITDGVVVHEADANGNWIDITVYGSFPGTMFAGNAYLKRIEFAPGITSIAATAFEGCSALTTVVLPVGLTDIGSEAFHSCPSLANVEIPESVLTIGTYAFYGCSSIREITIPPGVTSVGNYAFNGCTSLTTVYWNPVALATVGAYNRQVFGNCTSLSSFVFADDVTIIPAAILAGCASLTSVDIPEGVLTIGNDAMYNCTGITSLTVPASVTAVGQHSFAYMTGLKSVTWNPPAISSVGSTSNPPFEGCTAIESVSFASNVTMLPAELFRDATGAPMGDVVLPEGLTTIGADVFMNCGLTSVVIPSSVTTVGNYVFYNCTQLETVYWNPPAITSIGGTRYPTFDSCSALKNFVIADNVTILPSYLLRECTGIESITIPDSVATIGSQAFAYCTLLASVQVGTSDACQIGSIASDAFSNDAALTSVSLYKPADGVSGSPWGATNAVISWML